MIIPMLYGYDAMRKAKARQIEIEDEYQRQRNIMMALCSRPASTCHPVRVYPDSPSACPGCGSRETIIHHGRSKCSYCRGDR